jgi:hypothetical protein
MSLLMPPLLFPLLSLLQFTFSSPPFFTWQVPSFDSWPLLSRQQEAMYLVLFSFKILFGVFGFKLFVVR